MATVRWRASSLTDWVGICLYPSRIRSEDVYKRQLFSCTAAALLALCLTAARSGASALALALCGASSAALLGGALLLFSLGLRTSGLGLMAGTLWMGLCTPLVGLRLERWLAALPLWGWLVPLTLGCLMGSTALTGRCPSPGTEDSLW